jgi:hypothetical protein
VTAASPGAAVAVAARAAAAGQGAPRGAGLGGVPTAAPGQVDGRKHGRISRQVSPSGARHANMLYSHAAVGCLCACPHVCTCERPCTFGLQAGCEGANACCARSLAVVNCIAVTLCCVSCVYEHSCLVYQVWSSHMVLGRLISCFVFQPAC